MRTLYPLELDTIGGGDVVGIGIPHAKAAAGPEPAS